MAIRYAGQSVIDTELFGLGHPYGFGFLASLSSCTPSFGKPITTRLLIVMMKQLQSQLEMLSLNRDVDWNVARGVGMTTGRLEKKLVAKNQNLSRHHDWRIASSAPLGNCRLLARHHLRRPDSQAMSRSLTEATPAGGGRAPAVAVYVLKELIVQPLVKRSQA